MLNFSKINVLIIYIIFLFISFFSILNFQENKIVDKLWGLAWDVEDIKKTHLRLCNEGFKITPVKEGRKPNTLVATVKSDVYNIPTLLIQHLPS